MATTLDTQIRPEVRGVLSNLKSRIRWYVITEGLLMLLFLAAVIFWVAFLIDLAYFTIRKFELARSFRVGYVAVAGIVLAGGFLYWIGLRLFRSMREKPLALVLERRFPNLNDKLITSVEAGESYSGGETDLTRSMLQRTIDSATEDARSLRVGDVFEKTPLVFSGVASFVGVISIAALAIFAPKAFARVPGIFGAEDDYWDRDTELVVQVLLEDANLGRHHVAGKIAPFEETEEAHTYRHPLGAAFTLLITVPEKNAAGKKLVVPDVVRVHYALDGEWESKPLICKQDNQRERSFKATFRSLKKSLEFYVIGNDFRSRKPYKVEVEPTPNVVNAELECDYPAYTGYNNRDPKQRDPKYPHFVSVGGKKDDSLPAETRFLMNIKTNKPLQSAQVAFGPSKSKSFLKFGWELDLQAGETADAKTAKKKFVATLSWTGLSKVQQIRSTAALGSALTGLVANRMDRKKVKFTRQIPRSAAENFIRKDEDNPGISVPFILSKQETPAALARFYKKHTDLEQLFPGLGAPFHMPPGSDVEISLVDQLGIYNREAGKFTLQMREDQPPSIEAERRDIGDAVTRYATIPIAAFIKDDHGVAQAYIEYRVAPGGDNTAVEAWRKWTKIEFPPQRNEEGRFPRTYRFTSKNVRTNKDGEEEEFIQPFDYFNAAEIKVSVLDPVVKKMRERDLQPGDVLSLRVYAADADNLNGPNVNYSVQDFEFRIVTESELINILTTKENNARVRFEAILREIRKAHNDLTFRQAEINDWRQLKAEKPAAGAEETHKKKLADIEQRLRDAATISQGQFRKNHNETQEVESLFKQIQAELVNNHLQSETGAGVKRLEEIVQLLKQANGPKGDYKQLDEALDIYVEHALVPEDGSPPPLPDEEIEADLIRTVAKVKQLERTLNAALEKMKALAGLSELRKDLANIIDKQEAINRNTDKLHFRSVFGDGKKQP